MPYYDYTCSSCDSVFELSKKISERDETLSEICPECSTVGLISRMVGTPMVAYSVATSGYGKPPEGFREVLRQIHSRAPDSRMDKTSSFLT